MRTVKGKSVRALAILLCLVLVGTMLPLSALAASLKAPELKSAKATDSGIKVSWKAVDGAVGYLVYRKKDGTDWKKIAEVTGTSYTDKKAKAGVVYSYSVRATSGDKKSSYDKTGVSAAMSSSGSSSSSSSGSLKKPTLKSAKATSSGIKVTWKASSGATSYLVYRKKDGGDWKQIAEVTGTSYTDDSAKAGVTYSYSVRAKAGDKKSSYDKTGVTATAKAASNKTLKTPQLKKLEPKANAIKVTWKKVSGAKGYQIYRKSGEGKWKKLAKATGTSYTDGTVKSGKVYTYSVVALNSAGKEVSAFDSKGLALSYFKPPVLKSIKETDAGIVIEWKKVKAAPRYAVYRKSGTGSYKKIGNTTGTTYTDNTAKDGVTYTYTVRVISADGKTNLSDYNSSGISLLNVGKATISSLSNEYGYVLVKWGSKTGAVNYRLERRFGTGAWTKIYEGSATSFKDTDVVNNIMYSYRVRALNGAGNQVGTYDTVGKDITYYVAPTLVSCVRSGSSLVVTWEAVEGIGNYAIYRKTDTGPWIQKGTSTTTSFTDSTPPSGTTYWYTVRCLSASGSIVSSYDPIGIGLTSYTEKPVLLSISNQDGYVFFSWQAVDAQAFELVKGYRIYRKTGDKTSWDAIGTVTGAGTTFYNDTTVANAGTYTYSVAAIDASYNDVSLYNTTGLTITYYTKPTGITATNGATGVDLKWNAVQGIGTYQIYRKTGSGTWEKYATATTSGTTGTYTDTGVTTLGHYWYSVGCLKDGVAVSVYDPNGDEILYYEAPTMTGISIVNHTTIKVTWNWVDDVTDYRVYRKVGDGSYVALDDVYGATSYTDTTLVPGKKHYYVVKCLKSGTEVSAYNTAKGVSTEYLSSPAAPTLALSETKHVKVTWSATVPGATKYRVMRSSDDGKNWTKVETTTGGSFVDTDVTLGNTYIYLIVAGNDKEWGPNGTKSVKMKIQ